MKIHSGHIEVAVAKLLDFRVYTIVPNVSWGLGLNHECDMLALDVNKRFTEIEIKISVADLKRDFMKPNRHKSKLISRLVYAMPESIFEKCKSLIPSDCGIITVRHIEPRGFKAKWERQCKHKRTEPVPESTISKFMSLGCMRIWSLKEVNHRIIEQRKNT